MVRKLCLIIGFTGLLSFNIIGQNLEGPVTESLAGAGLARSGFWSLLENPAGIGKQKTSEFGYGIHQNYLLTNLTYHMAGLIIPLKGAVLGSMILVRDNQLYSDKKAAICVAKRFAKKWTAGVQIDYLSTTVVQPYGGNRAFTFETGFLFEPVQGFSIAVNLNNPVAIKRTDNNADNYPGLLRAGFGYAVIPEVTWFVDIQHHTNDKPVYSTGFEYRYHEFFQVRAGIAGPPLIMAFGGTLLLNNVVFDFSTKWHPVLGITPGLGIRYKLKGN